MVAAPALVVELYQGTSYMTPRLLHSWPGEGRPRTYKARITKLERI